MKNGKALLIVGTVLFTAFIGSDLLFTYPAFGDATADPLGTGSGKAPATKINSSGAPSKPNPKDNPNAGVPQEDPDLVTLLGG